MMPNHERDKPFRKTPRLRPAKNAIFAETTIEIPFHDVDQMGVAWHGNYLKYFEIARTALERRLDLTMQTVTDLGYICPVIETHCRHLSPLRDGDKALCKAFIVDIERTLWIGYEIFNETTHRKAAEGYTVQVALRRDNNELVLEMPDEIIDRAVRAGVDVGPARRG